MSRNPQTILVVGREYFFYTQAIVDSMRARTGADVRFVPIEPRGLIYKFSRFLPVVRKRWLDRFHRAAIAANREFDPDIVVFIQMHQIEDRILWYRNAFPKSRFILYYWDSIITHDYSPWIENFDRIYSFDPEDCARNQQLRYLPLFFVPELRHVRATEKPINDLSFVGTAVSRRRYDQLADWRKRATAAGLRLDARLVVSPVFFLRELLRGRLLRNVRFRAVSRADVLQSYANAFAVLDLPNNSQTGFTMRTFEALGAHRKLVTSNARVRTAEFHDPRFIAVLDGQGDLPPAQWIRDTSRPFPSFEAYSVEQWVDHLLDLDHTPVR